MSDQRLRELERRWKETGSPDDEAAYLLERVRVGDLTRERLELAAYCGHEGARRALACSRDAEGPSPQDWMAGLERFGSDVLASAAVHAASLALLAWEREGGEVAVAKDLLEHARRHIDSPSPEGSEEIIRRVGSVTSTQPLELNGASAISASVAAAFTAAWGGRKRAVNALVGSARVLGGEDYVRSLVSQTIIRMCLRGSSGRQA